MGKFVGGLITGSVLTLAGLGIAAAISDGTFDDLFDSDNSFDDSDDTEDLNEKESSDAEDDKDYVSPAMGTALSSLFRKAADYTRAWECANISSTMKQRHVFEKADREEYFKNMVK